MAVAIVLLAAAFRFYGIANQPMWYDELISMSMALFRGGLGAIWNVRYYPHPPLFPVLLYFILKVLPASEFAVRLLAVFASLLAFPFFYRLAADTVNKRTALVGMLLLAFSPFHIFYSQEGRPYSLMFTLVLVTVWVLYKALHSERVLWWVLHFFCVLALLYLHYFNWSIVGSEILFLLIYWRRYRRKLVPFVLSLLAAPLAIPPLLHLVRDSLEAGQIMVLNLIPVSISFPSTWMTLVAGETRYVTGGLRLAGVLVFGLLALAGSIRLGRHRPRLLVLSLCMIAVPFLFVFVVLRLLGQVVPPYEEKMFTVTLPFALILAASGVEGLYAASRSRTSRAAGMVVAGLLPAVLLGSNLLALREYYFDFQKNGDVRVIAWLESQVEAGDIVACDNFSMAMNLKYHWDSEITPKSVAWPRYDEGGWQFSEEIRSLPEEPIEWTVSLDDVLSYPRVWLVTQAGFGAPQLVSDLEALLPPQEIKQFGSFSVYLFVP